MKLDTALLAKVHEYSDVVVGNIYPAQGGRKTPGTSFWMVVAVSDHGATSSALTRRASPGIPSDGVCRR